MNKHETISVSGKSHGGDYTFEEALYLFENKIKGETNLRVCLVTFGHWEVGY